MNSSNISRLFIVLFILLMNLFLQFYFKYSIYEISLSEVNLLYLGNIFTLLLSFVIILGAVILYAINRGFDRREYSFILTVGILGIISYLLGYTISEVEYDPLNSYFFGLPSRRVYLALIFLFNLYLQFYLLGYIWGMIIGRQSTGSLKAFSGAFLAVSLALGFSYYFITSQDYRDKKLEGMEYYDTAVVLGAAVWSNNKPSTLFAGRIRKAYQVAEGGYVRNIQLTGGSAPGEISEAKAAENYLNELGLGGKFITIEEQTSTTSQQIEFIRSKYFENARTKPNVLIVSDDFHLPRALQMSEFFNIELSGLASDYNLSLDKLLYYRFRESIALLLFWLYGI